MNNALRKWVGTSWKMNKTLVAALSFAMGLKDSKATGITNIQPFVIPPFTCVREVKAALKGTGVLVGAQNMHWDDHGAWTGEISPLMLKDCDLDIVELGHSERRQNFGETNETVARKTAAAVKHGLVPLICVGESLAEREAGRASEVLHTQVRVALSMLSREHREAEVLFAYEPVWAIGERGVPATVDYASVRHAEIAAVAGEILGRRVPCLYGGSVNLSNCEELICCPVIDGLFIGRSAWSVEGYLEILARCSIKLEGSKE